MPPPNSTTIETIAYAPAVRHQSGYETLWPGSPYLPPMTEIRSYINCRRIRSNSSSDHEIETFDGGTGELVAWVRVPSLAGSSDTVLYMYYGNAGASDQSNASGVWDASYKGVWHLHGDLLDSTSSNNDGTNFGSTNLDGSIGDGQRFDGFNDYVQTPSSELKTADDLTVSPWFKADATNFAHHFVWEGDGSGNGWGLST